MRTFEDATGCRWDAAVTAASYGSQQLIFAARNSNQLRSCELVLNSYYEAEQMLLHMSEAELRQWLEKASEWRPG